MEGSGKRGLFPLKTTRGHHFEEGKCQSGRAHVSHTSVTHQCHTPAHTQGPGAGTSHLSPRLVFVLARCPCPRHSRAVPCQARQDSSREGLEPRLQHFSSSAGSRPRSQRRRGAPEEPELALPLPPAFPGMRSQGCGGAGDGAWGPWQESRPKKDLQRPALLPASSLRCRSTSPACPSMGGVVSPPHGCWRGGDSGTGLGTMGTGGGFP